MRRGILGGTFDPPHLAHLLAGEAAYRQLGLDVVTFIPAGAPWQKAGRQVSAAEHRWAMTELAVKEVGYFEADAREVHRPGWTYTVETLAEYPGDEELVLILGADAARGISGWHRAPEVLERAHLTVAPRLGTDPHQVHQAVPAPFVWLDMPLVDVSGTAIRRRVSEGRSVRFLVQEEVLAYLRDHRLYV
ncbi:MAG: nicotinate-nucleotide adenylyltransferase [Acidimicrobiia bacterium]